MTGQELHKSDFIGQTTVHPIGLAALIFLSIAIVVLPRKYATWPLILIGCFVAPAQRVMLGPLNFPFMRILLVIAMSRIAMRGEFAGIRLRTVDWLVVIYIFVKTMIYTLQYQKLEAFIFMCGSNVDVGCTYVAFRCLIRTWDDLHSVILSLIFASVPVSFAFLVESTTGRNLFAFLGGVPEITEIREGRLRCQGAFSHPILAGCYWASVMPLIAARWFDQSRNKLITSVGLICSIMNVLLSACSTPLMATIFALLGAAFYPLRFRMRFVRWTLVFTLFALHMSMNAPVWHLISRVNIMGGSTGWHRYHLMDRCIHLFGEWWLLGTRDTEHWGWGLWDVTNQFILEGVRGGFATMVLFILIISYTFRNIGQLVRAADTRFDRPHMILSWSLGVMMFVHISSFFAVSYFGQITTLLWLTVGASAGLCGGEGLLRNTIMPVFNSNYEDESDFEEDYDPS